MRFPSTITPQQICSTYQAECLGNPQFPIVGLNEIHVVQTGEITFVDHPKYYQKALKSNASVIIIDKVPEIPHDKTLIVFPDPFTIFKALIEQYSPMKPSRQLVAESAEIGEGTILQPGVFVGENVRIGKNCLIHANVSIYQNTRIGNTVIIHANSTIGGDAFYVKRRPQGYEKFPSCGSVLIEDDVEIGSGCTIDRGVTHITQVGQGTKIDNQVHIGHDTILGKHCLIAAQVGISGVVVIEDFVQIWGQAGIAKDLTIGKGAVVLPKSGVMRSLPGGKAYLGAPAEEVKAVMRQWIAIRKLPQIIRKFKI